MKRKAALSGWRVSFADYRGWPAKFAAAHPPVRTIDYADQAAALLAVQSLRADGMTACLTRAPGKRAYRRRASLFTEASFFTEKVGAR